MRKVMFAPVAIGWAALSGAQVGAPGIEGGTSAQGGGNSFDQFAATYSSWDATKVAWLLATIAIAYAFASMFFLMLLPNRNPRVAATYALGWGALAFIVIHIFAFGMLVEQDISLWGVVGIALGIFLFVWIVLALIGRKK